MRYHFLKLIKFLLPFALISPAIYPFINGLGCKYTYVQDGKYNFQEGVCKGGVLNVYFRSKIDDSVVIKRFLWGVSQNYVYTYQLSQQVIKQPREYAAIRINKLYDTSSLVSGYRVKLSSPDNTYLTFYSQPIEMIYISRVKGATGFF